MKPRTHTYARIWETVSRIPRGKVSTYGDIARLAGFPHQARLVGYAMHHIPHGADIPWHRVLNADGKISLPKSGGHYNRQRALLEEEGIMFFRERADLESYGWKPTGTAARSRRR